MLKHKALFPGLMAVLVAGFALGSEAIPNWSAPGTWRPAAGGAHTMGDVTNAMPFIGIAPCRIADTRGNGFTGAYGPPALVANANRSFTIQGQCGIPTAAAAVSFNFAALNIGGGGDLRVFPAGGSTPLVSTLNYDASTPNIANAAVVPLGTAGAITVRADAVPVDLIIDVNGYYADTSSSILLNPGVHFEIAGSVDPPFAALNALNNSTAAGAMAVLGIAGGATGTTIAVFGRNDGLAAGNTGVEGTTASTGVNSVGVRGIGGSGLPTGAATCCGDVGVFGESKGGYGVTGISEFGAGFFDLKDSGGSFVAGAWLGLAGSPNLGVSYFNGLGGSGAKSFLEVHPTDPTKMIRYVSLEGPEAGTYFRGTARVVHGQAVITVPEDFRIVTDDDGLTVQLTPVGASASMFIASEDLNQIVVRASKDVTFHYLVQGVRRAYKDLEPITRNSHFVPRSPDFSMLEAVSPLERQRLIDNGTYNADGTVNMATAERVGWAAAWREAAQRSAKLAAERARATQPVVPR